MDGTHEYEPDDVFYAVETAADAVADAIPGALRMRLPDQGHVADPTVLAATLRAFFREE